MKNKDAVRNLLLEGEGLAIEYKERFTARIAEDMVAFANTRGGTILLGVRDDGTIIGEKLTNALKAQIHSLARNCSPTMDVAIKQAGNVITIEVPEGREKPYSCSAGHFRRLDAVTQKMSNRELRIAFQETDPVRFEDKICRTATFEGLSTRKIRTFCKSADISISESSPAKILRGLELVTDKGISNAAVLMFGKKPTRVFHQCSMLLLAFKGTDNADIFDRMDIHNDLFAQFNGAIAFIKKHINRRSIIEGTYRRDVYEVPEPVIREAVANAIVHRDYYIEGTDVTVSVYDDRVEIKNPGGLPPGVSPELLGRVTVRRNPRLCEIFHRV